MKLRDRFFIAVIPVLAFTLSIFGTVLMQIVFQAQLHGEQKALMHKLNSTAYSIQAVWTNYALQGCTVPIDELVNEENIILCTSELPVDSIIYMKGNRIFGEIGVRLGNVEYMLSCTEDMEPMLNQWYYILKMFRTVYTSMLCVSGYILFRIAHHITYPLQTLTSVSQKLGMGGLNARVEFPDGANLPREIETLKEAFNTMAEALSLQFESRERFVADITHEIRTPLTSIMTNADMIRTGVLARDEMQQLAHDIIHESKRLNRISEIMTEWILLSREKPPMGEICISYLLCDAAERFPFDKIKVCAHQNGYVYGNQTLLSVLLSNLIRNAMNAGAQNIELEGIPVDVDTFRIVVSDDGCGIAEEALKHITEPFYRVDKSRSRAQGGIGLGLTLCREIAELHHARLLFLSAPGVGTKVMIDMERRR